MNPIVTGQAEPPTGTSSHRQKLGTGKILLFTSIVLALFYGLAEVAACAYLRHKFAPYGYSLAIQAGGTMRESSYQVWEHPPYYTTWSCLSHFNNYGLRRRDDISAAKPSGTTRIFIMGGSTAYGSPANSGVFEKLSGQNEYSSDETIAGWMERVLKSKYPDRKFEVINAATVWSKLHQQMIRYLRQIKDLSPDLIISIDGQNDGSLRPHARLLNGWEVTEDEYRDQVLATAKYRMRPLVMHSHAAYLCAMLLFAGYHNDVAVDDNLVSQLSGVHRPEDYEQRLASYYADHQGALEQRIEEYTRTLQYFHDILVIDKIPHLFVLQPLAGLDDTKPLTQREKAIQGYIFSHDESDFSHVGAELWWHGNFYRRVTEVGNRLREQKGVPFHPLLDPFRGVSQDVYTDHCHFTPAGNKVFTEKLIEKLEANYPELFNKTSALPP